MVKTSGKRVKFIINFQQILNTLFNIAVVIAGELRQGNKNYKIVIISARNSMYCYKISCNRFLIDNASM